jgi:hypothetical protein
MEKNKMKSLRSPETSSSMGPKRNITLSSTVVNTDIFYEDGTTSPKEIKQVIRNIPVVNSKYKALW